MWIFQPGDEVMIERLDWVKLIQSLINQIPFEPSVLYSPNRDPYNNVFLLAQIDIERTNSRNAETIVDFLHCVDEGWFFEGRASYIALKREVDENGLGGDFEE